MDVKQYGLIGEKLTHSFSKLIHEKLADYRYDLMEISTDKIDAFMKARAFSAINVTIPYKQTVMPYLDVVDESAAAIGAVNTIVNQKGKLTGYNTDFAGFLYTLKAKGIDLCGKIVLIMGSGGTCKTVSAVAQFQLAKEILVASRTKAETTITYEEALARTDIQVIINASPKGMYPNNDQQPVDLSLFPRLAAVVDVIYNPLQTRLLQQAKELGIAHANGLLMLVAQAKYAVEYFLDKKLPDSLIDEIYREIKLSQSNLVLIGMPGSGKSRLGRAVSELMKREFVDIDKVIQEQMGTDIPTIFEQNGEAFFRKLEAQITAELAKKNGLVISTGGGIIKNPENLVNLRQNGVIGFVDRPLERLAVGGGRPLSSSAQAVETLYRERYPIYAAACDFSIPNDSTVEAAVGLLKEKFYEIIGD